jgi:phosphoribosylformylglycinamidine synthase subunit PurS
MVRVRIEVRLRKGVTDPEGENVGKALRLLGFDTVRDVASARRFLIDLDERDEKRGRALAEDMCRRLLANAVIHEYTIDVERAKPRTNNAPRRSPKKR